ncbi:uncharacterized protein LOC123906234 [Trifolium pratense]|uniref:uncharacterized protein LOC123906234 n=1 Tax=Trifolium pratense TaxID=57577 RepID=UPI001E692FB0|nr:uncharacterized protein LOC123906234 [Trifolium pratense]
MGGQQRPRNQVMGFKVSHNPAGFDLMQNCDLPPPSKVFRGPDKTVILSMNRVCNISGKEEESDRKHYGTYRLENGNDEKDKVELLKALEASQTRAREAEKMAAILRKERDGLSIALLEEAMQLFACRQMVRLIELQVLNLQPLWLQQQPAMSMSGCYARSTEGAVGLPGEEGHDEETTCVTWVLALIFSLGIGVATALAWRY